MKTAPHLPDHVFLKLRQQTNTSDLDLTFGFGSLDEAVDFMQGVLAQPTDLGSKVRAGAITQRTQTTQCNSLSYELTLLASHHANSNLGNRRGRFAPWRPSPLSSLLLL